MTIITETLNEKPAVLIVAKANRQIAEDLRQELKKYNAEVFFSPKVPDKLDRYQFIFLLNETHLPVVNEFANKLILIFINSSRQAKTALANYKNTNSKIISLIGHTVSHSDLDKVLWFAFSQTSEPYLQITARSKEKKLPSASGRRELKFPSKKKLFLFFFGLFILSHLAFILPLILSSYFFYKGANALKLADTSGTEKNIELGKPLLSLSKTLFAFPSATFNLFSFSLPQDTINLVQNSSNVLTKAINLEENASQIVRLILKKEKTTTEKTLIDLRIAAIKNDMDMVKENLIGIEQKIPKNLSNQNNLLNDIKEAKTLLSHLKSFISQSDFLLAKDSQKTFLLLFANNMELRPGGGFIGSYAILTMKDYTLEDLKIYDVYDADGQLIAHVEPPAPIRNYLGQPHWFLRDSAFKPDFLENYAQAKFFLGKEMNLQDFSGAILLTTTAIQNILKASEEVYLADFDEKINDKNFYLKAQYYSEKNFFPGSLQKKNFLGSLARELLINAENMNQQKLAKELKKSLDEKQIVVYFENKKLQQLVDSLYWSGRTIDPACPDNKTNCVSDYLFPFDANLGVNKANFFVTRTIYLNIHIDEDGTLQNTLSVQIKNDSPSDAFPGGTYKNYFQIYLADNAILKRITKDGVMVENFDQIDGKFKEIGFLTEIKPGSITEIKLTYSLNPALKEGKNLYQLIFQKQTGQPNNDFILRLSYAKNIKLIGNNFPALVKDGQIIYNTSLTTDKIYLIELVKE